MTQEKMPNPESGVPSGVQRIVHRVRNEATEKQYSDKPWCGIEPTLFDGLYAAHVATIIDADVTCPACIQIIGRRQVETGTVDIRSEADWPMTHFAGHDKDTLCGLQFGKDGVQGFTVAPTLRETTCSKCLDQAEDTLTRVMAGVETLSRKEIDEIEQRVLLEGGVGALRDIAESLKQCAAAWKEEFNRGPESPAAASD